MVMWCTPDSMEMKIPAEPQVKLNSMHCVCLCVQGAVNSACLRFVRIVAEWSAIASGFVLRFVFRTLIGPASYPCELLCFVWSLHFSGVNWRRLSVFRKRRFCWLDAGWGFFSTCFLWIPRASPSALYRTSSMPALLSPAPLARQRPAAPPSVSVETHPGCHGCQVLHTLHPSCNRTHYFALPVHFSLCCLVLPVCLFVLIT